MKGRQPMSAEIVAVGTEILLGVSWTRTRLGLAVGDNKGRLVAARADLVVSTGGLGPTSDDLTHEALGQATGREMVEYPEARRSTAPSAYKQALFPEGYKLIANPVGTAMGALLEPQSIPWRRKGSSAQGLGRLKQLLAYVLTIPDPSAAY